MRFKKLNGEMVSVNLNSKNVCKINNNVSVGQKNLGLLLKSMYPASNVLEDFIIPGERLSIDLYVPNQLLAFEFNGIQHYQYSSHFHNDRNDFLKQQGRDRRKADWCQLNGITLVEVTDQKITVEDLAELILNAIRKQKKSF